jgi:hypothetical protein
LVEQAGTYTACTVTGLSAAAGAAAAIIAALGYCLPKVNLIFEPFMAPT